MWRYRRIQALSPQRGYSTIHRLANHHRYCDFYSRRDCWLLCSENNQYAPICDVGGSTGTDATGPASEEGATKLSDKINPPGVALVTSLIVIPIAIIMAGTVSATDAAFGIPCLVRYS
ncbi:hypothetical protein ACLB1M_21215 [Escherichia coli]